MDSQYGPVSQHKNTPFKTPEQVAAADANSTAMPLLATAPDINHQPIAKRKGKYWPPSKQAWLIISAVILLLAAGSYWYLKVYNQPKVTHNVFVAKQKVQPSDTVASSLTGLQVSKATNALPITAIMVENSLAARPESGLGEAGVVFEAMAEGGITRFVALYQSNAATSVGPIRSARPYFISWMMGFDADYAHVGGSPQALSDIQAWGVKDLNQFYNGSYYQRISTRQAPHNVYSTLSELYQLEVSKGYTTSTFTSWPRKAASPLNKPTVTKVNLTLTGPDYNDSYTYVSSNNTYARDNGGAPQIDADTNEQIHVPVVIAIVVNESNGPLDSSNAYYSDYQTIGSGTVYVFEDGGVTIGQWSKSSNSSQILFTKSNGQPLALDPGEVWITAVTSKSAVSYN